MFIYITVSLFQWFLPRWTFRGAQLSGSNYPTIHDSSVDYCVEIVVVALAAYSLVTP